MLNYTSNKKNAENDLALANKMDLNKMVFY